MSTLLPAWPTLHGNPLSDLLDELQSVYFGTRFKPKTITMQLKVLQVVARSDRCSPQESLLFVRRL